MPNERIPSQALLPLDIGRRAAIDSTVRSLLLCATPIEACRTMVDLLPLPEIVRSLDRLRRPEYAAATTQRRALEARETISLLAVETLSLLA